MTLIDRWRVTWQGLGIANGLEDLFPGIVASYSEPGRAYHTIQHIEDCLRWFDDLRDQAEHSREVEAAIWFHDAIYKPSSRTNEEESAAWAVSTLSRSGVPDLVRSRIAALILATNHNEVPSGVDTRIIVDVDLGILGADPARFDRYEDQVRSEYAHVPDASYRRERRKILAAFSAREAIYTTAPFKNHREPRARANLARSLARLET